jgi:predicted transcriptional regulator YdeE
MSEETVEREGFTIAGITCRTSNATPHEIGALWQKFFAGGGANQIRDRKSDELYAVYTDYDGDYTQPYTLIIGCEVASAGELPAGQVARAIPRQRYRVFDGSGEQPAALIASWQRVYQTPLARAYAADFDHYRNAKNVLIHVGIRQAKR